MIAVAFLAFLGHLAGMIVSKTGLFLQKLTHIERERRRGTPTGVARFDDNFERIDANQERAPYYCNFKWICGLILLLLGGLIQLVVLPFADLVLISTNSITAIAYNTFLSIRCLGEKFVWKYDLPAFVIMGAGAVTIVMLASTTEKVFTAQKILSLLFSNNSFYFALGTAIFLTVTIVYIKIF